MALLDPRRHQARTTPATQPPQPATRSVPFGGGAITSNAGGSVFVLPHATRAHLAELRSVLDRAMEGRT